MSSADHIDPSGIPEYTGDLERLEASAASLKKEAGAIRGKGADIHSGFQGLRAYYTAPEADQLFATTAPVAAKADAFADDLEKVGSALDGFASEVRPLVARLKRLRESAAVFAADAKADEDWQYNDAKVALNRELVQDVSSTVQAFWAAEVAAANTITSLVDGTHWSLGDGTEKAHTYGLTKDAMLSAAETPWGTAVETRRHWYDPRAVAHWTKEFVWDGFAVDGIWGTLNGLGTLLNPWSDAFGASWKGLANAVGGLGQYTVWPFDWLLSQTIGGGNGDNEQKKAFRDMAKGLVAWDEWDKNSGRAAGGTVFSVLTTFATAGAGGAAAASGTGAAAKAARIASTVGKTGRILDPATHLATAVGAAAAFTKLDTALSTALTSVKAGTALEHLRHAMATTAPPTPHGPLIDLPPGTSAVHLPEGTDQLPPNTVEYDRNTYLTHDGEVVDANGTPKKHSDAPGELSAEDRGRLGDERATAYNENVVPAERELVVAGADRVQSEISGHKQSDGLTAASDAEHGGRMQFSRESHGHHQGSGQESHHTIGEAAAPSSRGSHEVSSRPGQGHPGATGEENTAHAHSSGGGGRAPHAFDPPEDDVLGEGPGQPDHSKVIDRQAVDDRIDELDDRKGGEGHAPGRHLTATDDELKLRLGTAQTDANGELKLYGPASPNVGHVKSENNVDPLTGTTTDGVTGRVHRVGGCATRFDRAEDMVSVDRYYRNYISENGHPPDHDVAISDVLGADGYKRLSGFYRDPGNPREFLPIDFEGGTIKAVYKYRAGRGYFLHTMYPNHAPGRHP
ncbi:hypothetical protein [Streptomyces pinistramenti]|uniref:hypothetical protein n=1 Tax=Streptomyces pinistramenti TaxID=2884812 RepID=UPI001D06B639|nr:hypothetical protein [Streptomyces pinistramenti]MCB5907922.1 hypothetical protein [Streptomyces pinistramenti]